MAEICTRLLSELKKCSTMPLMIAIHEQHSKGKLRTLALWVLQMKKPTKKWLLIAAIGPSVSSILMLIVSILTEASISLSQLDAALLTVAFTLNLTVLLQSDRPRRLAKLAALQWSMFLGIALAETGLRVMHQAPRTPWDQNTVREINLSAEIYGLHRHGTFTTNSLGLRGSPMTLSELRTQDLSVLCVGGSTTECFYNSDETCWTGLLQKHLQEGSQASVFVGNAGRGGHVLAHHEYQLRHFFCANQFDRIILLAGWNDMSNLLYGDPGKNDRDIGSEALMTGPSFAATMVPHLPLYRNFATFRLIEDVIKSGRTVERAAPGWRAVVQDPYGEWILERRKKRAAQLQRETRSGIPEFLDTALADYRVRLERVCGAINSTQQIILLTQPTLCSEAMPESLESRMWSCNEQYAWDAASTRVVLDEYNDVTRSVAVEKGLTCIDLASEMSGNPEYFYDECHFTNVGCKHIAERLAKELVGAMGEARVLASKK